MFTVFTAQTAQELKTQVLEKAKERLPYLLMTDVSSRYAMLLACGVSHQKLASLDLSGAPALVANVIALDLVRWASNDVPRCREEANKLFAALDAYPLPHPGITLPQKN